jgi:hypothetical protein
LVPNRVAGRLPDRPGAFRLTRVTWTIRRNIGKTGFPHLFF